MGETGRRVASGLGMQVMVQKSFPRGLDMAAAILDACHVGKNKIHNWMKRQQTQELEDSMPGQLGMCITN